jgi:putative ABC transport system permease protein
MSALARSRIACAAALRFAARDLRKILLDYRVLVLCVAIGVAAVTGVTSLTQAFLDGLSRDARAIVGGDISFSRPQRPLDEKERTWLAARATISELANTRVMASNAKGETALVDIKAIEPNYPLAGAVVTNPARELAALDAQHEGHRSAVADPTLLARLGLKTGDHLRIGAAEFDIAGTIVEEPDRLVSGAAFAPRLILSRHGLEETGLVAPESLVRYTVKAALRPKATDGEVDAFVAAFRKEFPQADFEVRTRANASPQVSRIVDRVSKFLVVMSLLSVVVGGIGVWNAVTLFVDRQRRSFAILKTVGASGAFVFGLTLLELLILSALGVAIGAALGAALPFAMPPLLARAGFTGFEPIFSWRAIAAGVGVGFSGALLFSILPAGVVHDVPGSLLLSDDETSTMSLRWRYRIVAFLCLVLFTGVVGLVSGNMLFALAVIAGTLALAVLLDLAGRGFARLVRVVPRPSGTAAGLAWNGLSHTTRLSRAVIVSLGLGLIVLAATSGVTASLRAQLAEGVPDTMPDLFLVGVPAKDAGAFRSFLETSLGPATIEEAPLMRGRIVEIKGVPAEQVAARDNAAWVLDGDRGITYATHAPRDSTIVAGQWWPADYDGPPLVSLGANAAQGLGLTIGDAITVNVGGRRITATIANLRDINWASFGINFVLVFSPKPLSAAPHTILFTAAAPALKDPARETQFVRAASAAWPSLATIEIRGMLEQAGKLVERVGLAIQACSIFAILAAACVLAGAVAADQRARGRTTTILKILGGTRRDILLACLMEFAVLGAATALFAILGGSAVAWGVVKTFLDTPFLPGFGGLAMLLAAAVAAIAVFGLAGNWALLSERPARALRRL